MKHVEFYRNDTDGNVLVLSGGQAPEKVIYNGQELTHLAAGSVDAAHEKHVPAFQKIDGHLDVTVGSVTHPMEEKHYIEWIALVDEKGVHFHYLKPGEAPQAILKPATAAKSTRTATCTVSGKKASATATPAPSMARPAPLNLAAAVSMNSDKTTKHSQHLLSYNAT